MKINKLIFKDNKWNILDEEESKHDAVDIVFVFGYINILKQYNHSLLLKTLYPNARVVGCSTAGNILDATVDEYEVVASAISFDKGYVKVFSTQLIENKIPEDTKSLIDSMTKEDLKHIFVLTPGLINGSDIIKGIEVEEDITITGALAGDEYKFESTYLFVDDNSGDDLLVAVGFYGETIYASVGCATGWDEFGATRVVTKSKGIKVYNKKRALSIVISCAARRSVLKQYCDEEIED